MKKFKFPLEKILEYRSQLESTRLSAYGKAAEVFRRRKGELDRLNDELSDYRGRMAEKGVGRISPRELALYRSWLSHCELKVGEAADWMTQAARDMEERKTELINARSERRIMERLKEIKRDQYDYEAAREEIKELDEVGATSFIARRSAEGGEI